MWQICSINMTNLWGQTCNSGNNVCPIPVRVLIGFNNGNKDGVAHVAGFSDLTGIAVPPNGTTFYLTDWSSRIRSLDLTTMQVDTVAGSKQGLQGFVDGTGTYVRFQFLYEKGNIVITPSGDALIVADSWNAVLRYIDLATRKVSTLAGLKVGYGITGDANPGLIRQRSGFQDGSATSAKFGGPGMGISLTPDGRTLFVTSNSRIRTVAVERQCAPCPAHSSSLAGMTFCTCDIGYTGLGTSSSQCLLCPAGTYKDTVGSTPCTPCPANTFSAASAVENITARVHGTNHVFYKYRKAVDGTLCVACPAGSSSTAGSSACLCNKGFAGPAGGT